MKATTYGCEIVCPSSMGSAWSPYGTRLHELLARDGAEGAQQLRIGEAAGRDLAADHLVPRLLMLRARVWRATPPSAETYRPQCGRPRHPDAAVLPGELPDGGPRPVPPGPAGLLRFDAPGAPVARVGCGLVLVGRPGVECAQRRGVEQVVQEPICPLAHHPPGLLAGARREQDTDRQPHEEEPDRDADAAEHWLNPQFGVVVVRGIVPPILSRSLHGAASLAARPLTAP